MSSEPFGPWQPLGNGIHSVVWRARKATTSLSDHSDNNFKLKDVAQNLTDELSRWVAIKVVYDNRTMPPHDIVREAAILRAISHSNIINLVAFTEGSFSAQYALYMPLIPLPLTFLLSSPLFTASPLAGPYSALSPPVIAASEGLNGVSPFDVVAKSLVYQLILAIAHLHSLEPPVAHRDINPSNVLIDQEGTVKLIDFGIAWSPGHVQSASAESIRSPESSRRHPFGDWIETEERMCCEVSTGPYRAPELLFSPQSYSAVATDLWSLGTTIAQFFTALRLVPSHSPISSSSSASSDEDECSIIRPFLIPPGLKTNIDYRATWERLTLFTGDQGELRLAWSIFKLRGTPNERTWPSFSSLPDAKTIEFQATDRKPLNIALPHLSPHQDIRNTDGVSVNNVHSGESPLSLIDSLLAYPPASRLSAAEALNHPWFSAEVLLPLTYPAQGIAQRKSVHEHSGKQTYLWGGRSLGEWLRPAIRREAVRVTHDGMLNP